MVTQVCCYSLPGLQRNIKRFLFSGVERKTIIPNQIPPNTTDKSSNSLFLESEFVE